MMAIVLVENSDGRHTIAEVSDSMGKTAINYLNSISKAYGRTVEVCQEFEPGVFLCGEERDARIAEDNKKEK